MILQRLEIHNIASIEDATIDFEAQPLADSEVFLITGKTGAGKSTILDAICLALYANTPRLDNTLMQGDTKDQDKVIKITDPVQLMRRNTGEAYVNLTFTGSNGIHYEACWSVARARNKVTGKIQGKRWALHNLDNDMTYNRKTEIEAEIAAAIGLDFKQFCRTTLLAQGEFTRFLNSKDDEKAEILEKITGVDAYSKIGAKIWEKTSEMQAIWEESKKNIEGIQLMSDELIGEKKAEIQQLDEQEKKLKGEIDELRQATTWQKDIAQNKQAILLQEQNLSELSSDYQKLLSAQAFEQDQQAEIALQLKKTEDFLQAENENARTYENAQHIISLLSNIDNYSKQIAENQKKESELSKDLSDTLQPQLEKEQNALNQKREEYRLFTDDIKQKEENFEKLKLSDLRHRNEEITSLLADFDKTKMQQSLHAEKKEQYADGLKNLATQQDNIKEILKETETIAPLVHDAGIAKETLKNAFEQQRESINRWAKSIRPKLSIGDTCPVCQQKINSALPHEDAIDSLVAEAEKLWKEAETKYERLLGKKNKLEADAKALNASMEAEAKTLEKMKVNLEKTEKEMKDAEQKCLEALKAILENDGDHIHDGELLLQEDYLLQHGELLLQKELQRLTAQIKEAEAEEKVIKDLKAQAEKLRQDGESQRDRMEQAQKQFDKCKQQIQVQHKLIESQTEEKKRAEASVSELIELPASPMEYAEKLKAAATLYNKYKDEKLRQEALLNKYVVGNDNVATAMKAILKMMPSWEAENPNNEKVSMRNLIEQVTDLQGKVATSLAQIKSSKEKLEETQHLLEAFIEKHPEDSVWEIRLSELEASQKILSDKRGGMIRDLEIDRENKEKVGSLIAESEKKKAEYEKWSRLNQLLGDKTGNKFRRIAQSYVLASLIHSANGYMRTLSDRYLLKVVPGSFVITMEDAYQGYASRAASTLSGGESFLVSLSLALALSDIGTQLSVDTLFIDEGFGTLSGEPLQHAINTLRSLHSKSGRHVGIISHVEELKERIPVQIRVNQEGNNSSSTIEVVG